jgi:uncharacterized protein DUF6159
MSAKSDAPASAALRWLWAVVGAWVAALAWNAAIDNTDDGDPAASVGHELAALAPLACAVVAIIVVGAMGARRSTKGSATRTAFQLVALGGVTQLGALTWGFISDVTTPHRGSYEGLLLSGLAAFVVGVAWLAALSRRPDRGAAPAVGLAQRWGRPAYLAVFAALSVLALLTLVVPAEAPNAVAAVIGSLAMLAWLARRALNALRWFDGDPAPPPASMHPERPDDPATRHYLPPAGEGRIARSWRLTRTAWAVLRRDPTMVALAAMSLLVTAAGTVALFWAAGWRGGSDHTDRLVWVSAVAAWPLTFVGTFFNVALAAAAAAALQGERMSLGRALGVSVRRLGQIALWSLLAAGVGVALREIAERVPFGARVATWIVGAAWGLVTFFAVPILALEGCTATACVTRSTRLIKRRWGEGVGGTVLITAWAVVVAVPAGMLMGVGLAVDGVARIVLIVFGALVLLTATALSGAVRQVFAVALYRYATAGDVLGGFSESDLDRPFTPRRRWLHPGR